MKIEFFYADFRRSVSVFRVAGHGETSETLQRVTDDRDRSVSRADIKLDIITKLPRACTNDTFAAWGEFRIRIYRSWCTIAVIRTP